MISDSVKRDFKIYLDEDMTITGFMIFLKYHIEARLLLKDGWGDDYDFLETMSDEAIHKKYDQIEKDVDSSAHSDCIFSLYCFMYCIEEDDGAAQEIRSFVKGFTSIFTFKAGIPNVCNIHIGDKPDDCWIDAVQDRNTGVYDFDSALDAYYAFVDFDYNDNDTINEIKISVPYNEWSYEDLKELYSYISREFPYEKRNASYSFDKKNYLSDIEITLSNSLYGIAIYNEEYNGIKNIIIKITQQHNEPTIYKALNILLTAELTPLVVSSIHKIIANYKAKNNKNSDFR